MRQRQLRARASTTTPPRRRPPRIRERSRSPSLGSPPRSFLSRSRCVMRRRPCGPCSKQTPGLPPFRGPTACGLSTLRSLRTATRRRCVAYAAAAAPTVPCTHSRASHAPAARSAAQRAPRRGPEVRFSLRASAPSPPPPPPPPSVSAALLHSSPRRRHRTLTRSCVKTSSLHDVALFLRSYDPLTTPQYDSVHSALWRKATPARIERMLAERGATDRAALIAELRTKRNAYGDLAIHAAIRRSHSEVRLSCLLYHYYPSAPTPVAASRPACVKRVARAFPHAPLAHSSRRSRPLASTAGPRTLNNSNPLNRP